MCVCLQMTMSAMWTMAAVITSVSTIPDYSTASVTSATHWTPTNTLVQVCNVLVLLVTMFFSKTDTNSTLTPIPVKTDVTNSPRPGNANTSNLGMSSLWYLSNDNNHACQNMPVCARTHARLHNLGSHMYIVLYFEVLIRSNFRVVCGHAYICT
jgi:hypothetical protein